MGFSPGELSAGIPDAPANGTAYGRQDLSWTPVVRISGDTMTGPLLLPAVDPLAPREATRKLYVDLADAALQNQITALQAGLVYVGAYDVVADEATWTLPTGLPQGPLPPANQSPPIQRGWYLVCVSSGVGIGNAPAVPLNAGDQLISAGPGGGTAWNVLPLGGQAATTANVVALNPLVAGWNNVQEAVEGLDARTANILASQVEVNPTVAGASNVQIALQNLQAQKAGFGSVGLGSGTGRQRVFTYNAPIWMKGVVIKSFSNAHYGVDFELYSNSGSPSSGGSSTQSWFLTLYGRLVSGPGGSPLSGLSLHLNASNQGVVCVQSDGSGTSLNFYWELLRGSFLSTGGGVEAGTQLAYLTNDMTIAKGA